MDNDHLNKYFSLSPDSHDVESAYMDIRSAGRTLAETINRLVPESPAKADLIGRLFRIVVDSELAIRMDGVNRTQSMVIVKN